MENATQNLKKNRSNWVGSGMWGVYGRSGGFAKGCGGGNRLGFAEVVVEAVVFILF